jgi:hypothetical protein
MILYLWQGKTIWHAAGNNNSFAPWGGSFRLLPTCPLVVSRPRARAATFHKPSRTAAYKPPHAVTPRPPHGSPSLATEKNERDDSVDKGDMNSMRKEWKKKRKGKRKGEVKKRKEWKKEVGKMKE